MKQYVYSLTNDITGKKYFGVTQEPDKRYRSHRNMLNRGVHNNYYLQKDWEETSFTFEIIYEFDSREEAESKEMELVRSTDDVYNIVRDSSVGGDYFTYNPRKEKIVEEKRRSMTGRNNHQYGKPKTDKMIQAVKKANSKPISIEGVEYPSIAEASKALGVNGTTIGYRLNSESERFKEWYYV